MTMRKPILVLTKSSKLVRVMSMYPMYLDSNM